MLDVLLGSTLLSLFVLYTLKDYVNYRRNRARNRVQPVNNRNDDATCSIMSDDNFSL